MSGKQVGNSKINKGSTISYFDTETLYGGTYLVKISSGVHSISRKMIITK